MIQPAIIQISYFELDINITREITITCTKIDFQKWKIHLTHVTWDLIPKDTDTGLEIHACKLAKCELKFSFASWKYRYSKKVASSIFHLIPNPYFGLNDVSPGLQ